MLRSSIDECVDIGLEDHGEVRNATLKLKILEARKSNIFYAVSIKFKLTQLVKYLNNLIKS